MSRLDDALKELENLSSSAEEKSAKARAGIENAKNIQKALEEEEKKAKEEKKKLEEAKKKMQEAQAAYDNLGLSNTGATVSSGVESKVNTDKKNNNNLLGKGIAIGTAVAILAGALGYGLCTLINRNKDTHSDDNGIAIADIIKEEKTRKPLTDKEFANLVNTTYEQLTKENLPVSKQEVMDYVMYMNIDQIAEDNSALIDTVMGDRDESEVTLDVYSVLSRIATENNNRWCAKGMSWDELLMNVPSDVIFDESEAAKTKEIESRVKEIAYAGRNGEVDRFNILLNNLLMDILNAKEDTFKLESGNGFNVMSVYFNFIRINYQNILNKKNAELIKYFVVFAGDGLKYEEDSKTTEYWRGIYYIISDCDKEEVKNVENTNSVSYARTLRPRNIK